MSTKRRQKQLAALKARRVKKTPADSGRMLDDRLVRDRIAEAVHQADPLEPFVRPQLQATLEIISEGRTPEKIREVADNAEGWLSLILARLKEMTRPCLGCPDGGGCTYCCYQGVVATVPEILLLADYLRHHRSADELEGIKNRCRDYITAIDGKPYHNLKQACPFLEGDQQGVGGKCSVYEVRPLVCRGYHSLDVVRCKRAFDDPQDKSFMIEAWGFPIAQEIGKSVRLGLIANGLDGSYFKLAHAVLIALETPDAAERYLAGEPIFDSVRMTL
jgi:Fe-S-cluster containining protein